MPTIHDETDRAALVARLGRLTPRSTPRWGGLDCPRMLGHLIESLHMALGELRPKPRRLPLRWPIVKQLVIYIAPFPKGAPTAPELLARPPGEIGGEIATATALVDRVGGLPTDFDWPEHPAFGRLSRRAWGVLIYRHFDHHLRQFGA